MVKPDWSENELKAIEAGIRFKEAYDGLFHIRHVLWATLAAQLAVAATQLIGPLQTLLCIVGVGMLACWHLFRAHRELEQASEELNIRRDRVERDKHG